MKWKLTGKRKKKSDNVRTDREKMFELITKTQHLKKSHRNKRN